jgi:hypothetical protein
MSEATTNLRDDSAGQELRRSRRASPLTKPVPTARIAYPKQLALLRGYAAIYGQTGDPVTNGAVAAAVEMSAGTVGLANAFFTDVGFLIKQDGGFVPSADVVNFERAHHWKPDTAGHELRAALLNSWFGAALSPKLSVQGSMAEQAALAELSKESGATTEYVGQLRMLLDYMETGGLIEREGDVIRRAAHSTSKQPLDLEVPPKVPPKPDLHPFFQGLLQELPDPGTAWPEEDQKKWLEGWKVAFGFVYKTPKASQVTAEHPLSRDSAVEARTSQS